MRVWSELLLMLALAPLLLVGYLIGFAWIALFVGFKLAGITIEAMGDNRAAWTLVLNRRTPPTKEGGDA